MAKYRRGRINDEVKSEIASILRDVKDPRVRDAFISIVSVDVTPDLKYAKIYFSALYGDKKEVLKGLAAATGFIRARLAQNLNLRITPELSFVLDDSIKYGAHISELLNNLKFSDDETENIKTDGKDDNEGV